MKETYCIVLTLLLQLTKRGGDKMKKLKKIILALVIILVIAIIVGESWVLIDSKNKSDAEIANLKNQISDIQEKAQNIENEANSTEELIKQLFLEMIQSDEKESSEKLVDYKVSKVTILDDEEKQEILEMDGGQYYKSDDILACVTYSVKPQDINNSNWIAGNGTIEGEWIVDKVACISLRNGKIVSSGTGW